MVVPEDNAQRDSLQQHIDKCLDTDDPGGRPALLRPCVPITYISLPQQHGHHGIMPLHYELNLGFRVEESNKPPLSRHHSLLRGRLYTHPKCPGLRQALWECPPLTNRHLCDHREYPRLHVGCGPVDAARIKPTCRQQLARVIMKYVAGVQERMLKHHIE